MNDIEVVDINDNTNKEAIKVATEPELQPGQFFQIMPFSFR